jgi:hypothetical protein
MIQVKWKKINEWAIECGQINVTKAKVMDTEKFVVWNQGKLVQIYKTSKEAKDHAISLIETINANADTGIKSVTRKKSTITNYN